MQTHKGGCTFTQPNVHAENTQGGDDENPRLRQDPAITRSLHYLIWANLPLRGDTSGSGPNLEPKRCVPRCSNTGGLTWHDMQCVCVCMCIELHMQWKKKEKETTLY